MSRTASPDALRAALVDQLAYLIDEVEALKDVAARVPAPVQAARPPGAALTMKETYGLLAALDEAVYLPRLRRMVAEDAPSFEAIDEEALARQAGWNEEPLGAILARVQDARRALVAFLGALPPEAWRRTATFAGERRDVYGLAHYLTQHDTDLLRSIGYRLYESRLADRPR